MTAAKGKSIHRPNFYQPDHEHKIGYYAKFHRLAVQKRRLPIEWKPGQREALIAQAVSAGKVQKCPAGHADGILIFNAGGSIRPTFGAHKPGAQ